MSGLASLIGGAEFLSSSPDEARESRLSSEPRTTGRRVVGFSRRIRYVPGEAIGARAGIAGNSRASCATTDEMGMVEQFATS